MRGLADTIRRLKTYREMVEGLSADAGPNRLHELTGSGSNPGALRGSYYLPPDMGSEASLVVVLHGCTQSAAAYDRGSGWSQLADEFGFAVLFPEQQRANNLNLCFNWFDRKDTRRDSGEALSIRQMIDAMISTHGLDPTRVYVTGLSAGGAMTSVMLATYPEVFAGGAIIAGLPYGTAGSVPEALERMRARGGASASDLADIIRRASHHQGPWPVVSVWHGGSDRTVSPANSGLVVEQWRALHGAPEQPARSEHITGHPRRVWQDAEGRDVIEEYCIANLGHGTPLSTLGPDACGAVGRHMLEAGISSTRRIADFWGLTEGHTGKAITPRGAE